jgi:hypothetical protein
LSKEKNLEIKLQKKIQRQNILPLHRSLNVLFHKSPETELQLGPMIILGQHKFLKTKRGFLRKNISRKFNVKVSKDRVCHLSTPQQPPFLLVCSLPRRKTAAGSVCLC